jgi:cyclohexa-1,5-dienecarbonyl-CoA hydratase
MLPEFHALFRNLFAPDIPLVALVCGQCLGGGFELAAACDLVFAETSAHMGVPEIRLGVFPPVACALLPGRVGVARANDLLLTGRSWTAPEAHAAGLVTSLSEPGELEADFQGWVEKQLLPLSGSSLRIATRAARLPWRRRFLEDLQELERLYLEDLVSTHDANEGIEAFLEKRSPTWDHGLPGG